MRQPCQWKMDIGLDEIGGVTRAEVRLGGTDGTRFTGIGLVETGPRGVYRPDIAAELALARALSDLTEELLEAAASDIDTQFTFPGPRVH
ncbi:hypothetical protein GCM10017786_09890 [Amycolatopsis deserti]|uniref:DUF1876 domain-containing protein n=1 Tax=Amycolatopsis deserti TaxID=185696 RepID=A0ABQ3IGJ1_9PSEU|nr:dsRBD fold-containing protein [Amycolatopsis deserti]GHE81482.1 hypothetical protein GCM10017786_09890 [Amycolatopsis deserti]